MRALLLVVLLLVISTETRPSADDGTADDSSDGSGDDTGDDTSDEASTAASDDTSAGDGAGTAVPGGFPWRDDLRCGTWYLNPAGKAAECDPHDVRGRVCCSTAGWCGNTTAHCDCAACVDYTVKKWRTDLRCGEDYLLNSGEAAECNPNHSDGYRCCSTGGWCGNEAEHCDCTGCVDYGEDSAADSDGDSEDSIEGADGIDGMVPWRDDLRCGEYYLNEEGDSAECNPNDDLGRVCCSTAGWCGNSAAHCDCASCVDYSVHKWRSDLRCGSDYVLNSGVEAECDPSNGARCCSTLGWCGNSSAHCDCIGCVDYGATELKTVELEN